MYCLTENNNPFAQAPRLYAWQMQASAVNEALLEALEYAPHVLSVGAYVEDGRTAVTLYAEEGRECAPLHAHLAAVELATGIKLRLTSVERVKDQDWVLATQEAIRPQVLGAFAVLGSHHTQDDLPHGKILVRLDAGAAFGTGEHGTTSGCLLALTHIAKQQRFRNVLDMGCGTAILGMAAAGLHPCRVLAVDNDPTAVRVAKENIQKNRLRSRVDTLVSEGFRDPAIAARAPYDVVIANILARPVRQMAGQIAACLAPNGYAVLSGFYAHDIAFVMARYRLQGFAMEKTIIRSQWATLVLRKVIHTSSKRHKAII
jgi:ribosomal protein L11 methyltransferase